MKQLNKYIEESLFEPKSDEQVKKEFEDIKDEIIKEQFLEWVKKHMIEYCDVVDVNIVEHDKEKTAKIILNRGGRINFAEIHSKSDICPIRISEIVRPNHGGDIMMIIRNCSYDDMFIDMFAPGFNIVNRYNNSSTIRLELYLYRCNMRSLKGLDNMIRPFRETNLSLDQCILSKDCMSDIININRLNIGNCPKLVFGEYKLPKHIDRLTIINDPISKDLKSDNMSVTAANIINYIKKNVRSGELLKALPDKVDPKSLEFKTYMVQHYDLIPMTNGNKIFNVFDKQLKLAFKIK